MKTLNELKVGSKGIIKGYTAVANSFRDKLLSFGLTKGAEVSLVRVAPLGDPLEIKIRDFSLSVRRDEAQIILIED